MLQKISPRPSCLPVGQEKDSQRGVIPPFCKGREEGFGLHCPYNYGLIIKPCRNDFKSNPGAEQWGTISNGAEIFPLTKKWICAKNFLCLL